METQLISVNDLGYMRHNRAYANRYRHTRRNQGVDTVAREFHKQLMLVERDITQWFARLINSKNERILRYKSSNGMLKYQEIDFIAENEFGLKFCELKLKERFKESLSERSSGIAQLNTTMKVASSVYQLNGSLAICIDMTFLYTGLESEGRNFTDVAVLPNYFQQKGENNYIWLDIKDVLSVALQEGLFTSERIEEIRELHEVMNNPLEMLPEVYEIPLNNPFSQLQATHLEC
ncbi:hypothetical protein BCU40_006075 [Vibrio lentus]|uniref:hypothetical protein n=1 Tax=Vibrio lentus TaxID=136468 RepID=UPI000C832E66|nr:hypothetical protein [Vibrio lentus]PMI64564.1 hypothetical protein BCU40_16515 [Vibrio lentus]